MALKERYVGALYLSTDLRQPCDPTQNLPENQCVFIRGFRVARTFRIMPKRLKAAAGPSPEPEPDDFEPEMELISIPATTNVEDTLSLFCLHLTIHSTRILLAS
jgi:hypothetical protein